MRKWPKKTALLAIGALATLLNISIAPPASAADPYVAPASASVCGSSYYYAGRYVVRNDMTDDAALYLDGYYSPTLKRNCLIGQKAYGRGTATLTSVRIRPSGYPAWNWDVCDSVGCSKGYYKYYAGPVYTPSGVDMSNRCVDEYGYANTQSQRTVLSVHC